MGFPGSSAGKDSTSNAELVRFLVGKICWGRDRLPTAVFLGFPVGLDGKESSSNAENLGWIPVLVRGERRGEEKGYPLHYSGLENSMDRGAGRLQSMGWQRVRLD